MQTSKPISSTTLVGLFIALAGLAAVAVALNLPAVESALPPQAVLSASLLAPWLLAGAVLLVVRAERQPLASIGLRPISVREGLLALGLGVMLSLLVPVLTLLAAQVIPATETGGVIDVAASATPGVLLLGIVTAAITEEILFRGYAIERLQALTGSAWLAVLISVAAFAAPHLAGWNLQHVVGVVVPLGVILAGLYLWKHSLVFNMIVHFMVNLPLVFFTLMQPA